jgi:hypothetical protein
MIQRSAIFMFVRRRVRRFQSKRGHLLLKGIEEMGGTMRNARFRCFFHDVVY